MKKFLVIISCSVVLFLSACKSKLEPYTFSWDMSVENHTGAIQNLYETDGKHRGMSVFHWRDDMDESLNQLIKNNVECIAVVPFLYQENQFTREMRMPEIKGKWSGRDSSFVSVIEHIHKRGLHVMLKPHLWMRDGWRSDIAQKTDEDWDMWFESYRKNMLHYAMMADSLDVELFCVGAELRSSILKQPHKWDELIKEIKEIYDGKLTYAANWDAEYAEVQFWDQMDFIGIQAYYPLTKLAYPKIEDLQNGWGRHTKMLEAFSKKHDKPILFTEIGYRSDNTSAIEPWVWDSALDDSISFASNETQNLAYEALFRELWMQKWFAGMYFWQWHNSTREEHAHNDRDFTPRFKPAENTMAKWYGKQQ